MRINWELPKIVGSGSRTRFAPGVIGRSSVILVTLLGLWGYVFSRFSPTSPWYYNLGLAVVAGGLTLFVGRQLGALRDFATRNPALAVTEGTDVIALKQIEAQMKGSVEPDLSPVVAGASLTTTAPVKIIRNSAGQILTQEPDESSKRERLKP
jgi:hypothetical protein